MGPRATFSGFAHDSRQVTPGEVFVATRGLHGDGHDYIEEAAEQGAAAALIARGRLSALDEMRPGGLERLERAGVAVIAVEEPREALKTYARRVIREWNPLVVAVTGGVGKTTTKEAIANALETLGPTFRSAAGLRRLAGSAALAGQVGAGRPFRGRGVRRRHHPGEIAELCDIARPGVGVVTNVAPTQLQYFGSLARLGEELARLPAAIAPAWICRPASGRFHSGRSWRGRRRLR